MKESLFLAVARGRGLSWLLALLMLAAWAGPAQAQITTNDPTLNNPAAPVIVRPDTATVRKLTKKEKRARAAADSAQRTERLFGFHVTRPQKAGLLALVPSGGQIYNRKYWKLPIVYGMVGGLGYWVFFQQRLYISYRYANSHTAAQISQATTEIPDATLRAQLAVAPALSIRNGLETARHYRDLSILLSSLGYGLQILDAVVDAHLHDFDVSDNLSLNWQPAAIPVPGQATVAPGVLLVLQLK